MKHKVRNLHIKASEEEVRLLHKRMEEAGTKNMSSYLLRMALKGYIIHLDMSDLKEISRLMQISSNNLNQYAKKANETESIYKEDVEDLKRKQKELVQLLGAVYKSLSKLE